jgi:hypothetical protein
LNTSRGVIRCRVFHDCDDTEVLEALSPQDVTEVKRILSKRNGMTEKTNTFIVTFGLPFPPKSIKAAYLKLNVDPYVPNPLRCFNCQKFGHGKANCKRKPVCAKCSQEGHSDCDCNNTPKCANCEANHCSFSKDCPEWKRQKEITRVKFEQNISFAEAKKLVDQTGLHTYYNNSSNASSTVATYAQATAKKLVSVSVQTDLSWTPDSLITVNVTQPTKSNSASTSMQTEELGAVGGHVPTHTKSNIPHYKSGDNKKQPGSKSETTSSKLTGKRPAKGSDDPVRTYNKYGSLDEDDVDSEVITSPKPKRK